MVGEDESLVRRSGWGGGVVGEEEWLGRRSGWAGGVVGEEEWLGRTHARLHARLARNPCTHVRLARTHAVTVHHARLACTHACIACTPYIHAYELFTCTSACFETRNFHEESHVIIIDYYYCSISLQSCSLRTLLVCACVQVQCRRAVQAQLSVQ